ncbi:MAG: hypothetical protein HC913_14940 [Microscillaceae bacterium]|nr:hypothetical protein [Microscillaceae bacterium]
MSKIGKEAQLAVKWANGHWTYYRVSKYRQWAAIVRHFRNVKHFRFAIMYQYNHKEKIRGQQIGYFDKQKETFC